MLGVEESNISDLIKNEYIGIVGPVRTENYLLNESIETNLDFTYVNFKRLVNGGPDDISLKNCNFMVFEQGSLEYSEADNNYLFSYDNISDSTFHDKCVTIYKVSAPLTNYTFSIEFAYDLIFTDALNNKTSIQSILIESITQSYVIYIKLNSKFCCF